MICDLCGANLAQYRVTRMVNGHVLNLCLCEDCYQNLDAVLQEMQQNGVFRQVDTPCPTCGTTFSAIRATGKFGCPNCYRHFKKKAQPLLMNIHGGAVHKGKHPSAPAASAKKPDGELNSLKQQLQKCIANQEFEQAAVLRDKIKELERGENEQ